MTGTSSSPRPTLAGPVRFALAVLGLAMLVPLVVARALEPTPQGYGTHEQLGLPPCNLLALTGRPCPTCGMTTSWANLVRARWSEAVRASPGGVLLGVLDLLIAPWLVLAAVRGRWIGPTVPGLAWAWLAILVASVTMVGWLWRLWSG